MAEIPFMALEKGFSKEEVTPGACEWVLTGALSLVWKGGQDLSLATQPKKLTLNGSFFFAYVCVCACVRVVGRVFFFFFNKRAAVRQDAALNDSSSL